MNLLNGSARSNQYSVYQHELGSTGAGERPILDGDVRADGPTSDWRKQLLRSKPSGTHPEGAILPVLANAIVALRAAPEWAGVLAFDEFELQPTTLRSVPWGGPAKQRWSDQEDRLTAEWLQRHGIMVTTDVAGQAVETVARDRKYHPIRSYLASLRWDGIERIDRWLSAYLGADDNEYIRAAGSRWLISAVARVYQPGVKADCCLILEGPQGAKKSTALRTLAGEYFTDELADLGSKDAALQTRGVWIIEIAELDSLTRSEVARIKAFMSRAADRFRPPYGKHLVECPRQSVFAGTVNHSDYLRDETGARRFWPVACGRIAIEALERDRDQLWAEAKARYDAGAVWWLDSGDLTLLAREQQAGRYDADPWQELIAGWTEPRESVSIGELLEGCLNKPQAQWMQADKNRIARSLRALGWERYQVWRGARREWRYRRAVSRA